jgi:hypothetical protein
MATRPTPLVVKQILARHNAVREGGYSVPPHVMGQIQAALLAALQAEHYAPNPRDLNGAVAAVKAIIEWEVNSGSKDLPEGTVAPTRAAVAGPSLVAMGHLPTPSIPGTPHIQAVAGQAVDREGNPIVDAMGRPLDAAGRIVGPAIPAAAPTPNRAVDAHGNFVTPTNPIR